LNRWARIVLSLSALSTAGWIVSGALGYRIHDPSALFRHTLIAFAALLGIVLTQAWIATFSIVSLRLARRLGLESREAFRRAARASGWSVIAALLSILSALILFTLSNALYPARLAARPHGEEAAASAAILVIALVVEARMLTRHGRAMAELEAEERSAAC